MSIDISVVVPTYFASDLHRTLESLRQQTAWDRLTEILVVGHQPEGNWQTLPKVHHINNRANPTPARNRNIGARHSQGTWVCFIDADCLLAPNWLQQCIEHIEEYRPDAVCGSILPSLASTYWGLCDHFLAFGPFSDVEDSPRWVTHCPSMNFCISKTLFESLGGFREDFDRAAGEDWELCDRILQHHGRILFVPAARVVHNHDRQDFSSVWKHIHGYGVALAQRRIHSGLDWRWKFFFKIASIPLILELLGLVRALARLPYHLQTLKRLSHTWWSFVGGITILEIALSQGIVRGIRNTSKGS